jgi:hypothetical protein
MQLKRESLNTIAQVQTHVFAAKQCSTQPFEDSAAISNIYCLAQA